MSTIDSVKHFSSFIQPCNTYVHLLKHVTHACAIKFLINMSTDNFPVDFIL